MTLLTIDFETYFDNECTLKKLNYIQYLNHPRFEVLGAAILTDKTHEFLPHNDLQDFLSTLDPETTSVLAHNTLFDGMILSWIYDFAPAPPARWLDTLSMSKGLLALDSYSLESVGQHFNLPHKKSATFKGKTWAQLTLAERSELTDYAKHDAWLCNEIYKRLQPYPENELNLIDLTIRMFTEPKFQLDIPLAEQLLKEQQDHKTNLLKETQLTKTKLASNQQFAKLLEEKYGIKIPRKISLTTNKETYALAKNDPEFQELQLNAPDEVKKLIDARLAIKSTIEETRINTLIETQSLVGAIPVPLIYYGGHTGRWSGFTYNLQNLPKISQIRNTLIAPPGYTLVIVDSSSIEARVLAWFAEQHDLVEIFQQKGDPYRHMASAIYNIPADQIAKKSKERDIGKAATLGCIAAGELVLTNQGLIPIENIKIDHTVWDGIEWVSHEGLIDQGVQEVIYHDGLWATPDHKVYLYDSKFNLISMREAASKMARLARTGTDRTPIRLVEDTRQHLSKNKWIHTLTLYLHGMWTKLPNKLQQLEKRKNNLLCKLFRKITSKQLPTRMAIQTIRSIWHSSSSLQQPIQSTVSKLRWSWDPIPLLIYPTSSRLGNREFRTTNQNRQRNRSNKQRRTLCTKQSTLGIKKITNYQQAKQLKNNLERLRNTLLYLAQPLRFKSNLSIFPTRINPTRNHSNSSKSSIRKTKKLEKDSVQTRTTRVYDLLNAGPRHRFTVSNCLVSNCGYGMGATKFQATLQKTGINIPFEESQRIVEIYRKTNNKIVQLWRYLDSQLHTIANGPTKASSFGPSLTSQTTYKCIEFQKNRILLPNGLYLKYPDLQQHDGWTYGNNKKIYGGALTENIIQALARIIIGEQALQAQKEVGPVVLLVHDEIVCCVATNQAEQALNKLIHIMQTSPTWAPDLPLDAGGEISAYYKK